MIFNHFLKYNLLETHAPKPTKPTPVSGRISLSFFGVSNRTHQTHSRNPTLPSIGRHFLPSRRPSNESGTLSPVDLVEFSDPLEARLRIRGEDVQPATGAREQVMAQEREKKKKNEREREREREREFLFSKNKQKNLTW